MYNHTFVPDYFGSTRMAWSVHNSGILLGNTDNVYSLVMVIVFLIAIYSSPIMEVMVYV